MKMFLLAAAVVAAYLFLPAGRVDAWPWSQPPQPVVVVPAVVPACGPIACGPVAAMPAVPAAPAPETTAASCPNCAAGVAAVSACSAKGPIRRAGHVLVRVVHRVIHPLGRH